MDLFQEENKHYSTGVVGILSLIIIHGSGSVAISRV